ncbi:MAG: membrane protein insertion efficiency factor YidD [Ruminococcus sp.]|nr:membrane protein insertion efficiency factor YidD [Ruminococcus sp.]
MGKEKRIVVRPKIKLGGDLLRMLLSAAIPAASALAVRHFVGAGDWCSFFSAAMLVIWFIFCCKHTLITLIYMYQKFAPGFIRSACRFTPCCSEYTRISIEKYGVFKGVYRGVSRIMRCHPPNGGIDEP